MSALRPQRARGAPAYFADEQAAAAELARLSWQERNPAAFAEAESSDSDDSDIEEGPEEDEERKAGDERPAVFPWRTEWTAIEQLAFVPPRALRTRSPAGDSPLDFFHLFLPNSYLESMTDLTNEYAEAARAGGEENAAAAAAPRQWQAASAEEMKALLGCIIYMGIVNINATRDYWAELTRQSFVADCFPRERFLVLLRCLRVGDEAPGADERLRKLQQLISTLEGTLLRYFYPGQHVCVDEVMVGFKGRNQMVQYIANKASPTGFKVWVLVDSATNYVAAFDVFTGRKGREKESGAAGKVVKNLLNRLQQHCFHAVTMDNFFSSIQLFEELLELGFYAMGTTRHNRKHFPTKLLEEIEEKQRGDSVWRQKKDSPLVAISWKDKKPVNFLSTCTNPEKSESVKRWINGERKEVPCPEVVPLYIQHMRGADVFAQRQSYNKIGRRSRKWFYSLLWFMVDVAIHNAYILFQQKHSKQHYDEKAFRKELMQLLVAGFSARGKSSTTKKRPRDSLHVLERRSRRGDCVQCRRQLISGQHGRRSFFACVDCNVFLCVPNCYNKHVQSLTAEALTDEL